MLLHYLWCSSKYNTKEGFDLVIHSFNCPFIYLFSHSFIHSGGEPGTMVKAACLPAWKVGDRGFEPRSDIQRNKMFLPRSLAKIQYWGSLRERKVVCSASGRQGSNFEFCFLEGSVISLSTGCSPGPVSNVKYPFFDILLVLSRHQVAFT